MTGVRFLSPSVKVIISVAGMALMGYLLYPAISSGMVTDLVTLLRGLVFLAFGYFLIRNLRALLVDRKNDRRNDRA